MKKIRIEFIVNDEQVELIKAYLFKLQGKRGKVSKREINETIARKYFLFGEVGANKEFAEIAEFLDETN